MTNSEREVKQYLELMRRLQKANGDKPKRWVYDGPADLLLREAEFFKPGEVIQWKHSLPNACFRNAAMYAVEHGLRYVEGYAAGIIPVHHGWCADDDGNVVEVTWKEIGSIYYGVEFPPMSVKRGAVLFNERNRSVYTRLVKEHSA